MFWQNMFVRRPRNLMRDLCWRWFWRTLSLQAILIEIFPKKLSSNLPNQALNISHSGVYRIIWIILFNFRPLHALGFASMASLSGLSILFFGCNGLTATLGAANLLLYTCIYTPLKRISILNTWVGSIGEFINFNVSVYVVESHQNLLSICSRSNPTDDGLG